MRTRQSGSRWAGWGGWKPRKQHPPPAATLSSLPLCTLPCLFLSPTGSWLFQHTMKAVLSTIPDHHLVVSNGSFLAPTIIDLYSRISHCWLFVQTFSLDFSDTTLLTFLLLVSFAGPLNTVVPLGSILGPLAPPPPGATASPSAAISVQMTPGSRIPTCLQEPSQVPHVPKASLKTPLSSEHQSPSPSPSHMPGRWISAGLTMVTLSSCCPCPGEGSFFLRPDIAPRAWRQAGRRVLALVRLQDGSQVGWNRLSSGKLQAGSQGTAQGSQGPGARNREHAGQRDSCFLCDAQEAELGELEGMEASLRVSEHSAPAE